MRAQMLAELRRESTDPEQTSPAKAWWGTAFPEPSLWPPEQRHARMRRRASQPTICESYARRVLARDKLKIAIVGDIDAATPAPCSTRCSARCRPRPSCAGSDRRASRPRPPHRRRSRRAAERRQLRRPRPAAQGSGLHAAFVVNHILGGGSFSSRLYQEVREKRGLAYGVSTYLLPLEHAALFMGGTQTRADAAPTKTIERRSSTRSASMAESGPTEEELAKAKDYLKGSYALGFDTSTKIAAQLVQMQIDRSRHRLHRDARNGLIDAVTLDDAKRVAKRLLDGGLLVTVVGRPGVDASTIRAELNAAASLISLAAGSEAADSAFALHGRPRYLPSAAMHCR